MEFKYENTVSIVPVKTTTWIVHFQDPEEKCIVIFGADAHVEDVIIFVRNRHPNRKFKVGNISAGEFPIKENYYSYGNGRTVNQDMYVGVES